MDKPTLQHLRALSERATRHRMAEASLRVAGELERQASNQREAAARLMMEDRETYVVRAMLEGEGT